MKIYKYAVFTRNPETLSVQHGILTVKSEGFLDMYELATTIKENKSNLQFSEGFTLIGMQVVSVEDVEGDSENVS